MCLEWPNPGYSSRDNSKSRWMRKIHLSKFDNLEYGGGLLGGVCGRVFSTRATPPSDHGTCSRRPYC